MRKRVKKMFISILIFIASIVVILFILAPHPPRVPKEVADIAELESYLNDLTESGDPPSLSLAVVKNNQIVYTRAFGMADAVNAVPATPETVYHWWSMTKMATATTILQMHEEGLLNIDDPVTDYLSFFEVEYPSADSPEITIRHLLNHTSGLPDTVPAMIGWVHYEDENYDQTKLLKEELPNYNELKFVPGKDSAYSNLGYMVLGVIIETVTELPYETYIEEQLLKPLGMTQTAFIYSDTMTENEAIGSHPFVNLYTPMLPSLLDMDMLVRERIGTRYWFNRVYIDATPSTGLIGPAEDTAKLMLVLLESETLLSSDMLELMRPNGDKRPLGWAEFGNDWVQHRGGGPGFATIMRLYPEKNLGITIVANSTSLKSIDLVELIAGMDW